MLVHTHTHTHAVYLVGICRPQQWKNRKNLNIKFRKFSSNILLWHSLSLYYLFIVVVIVVVVNITYIFCCCSICFYTIFSIPLFYVMDICSFLLFFVFLFSLSTDTSFTFFFFTYRLSSFLSFIKLLWKFRTL